MSDGKEQKPNHKRLQMASGSRPMRPKISLSKSGMRQGALDRFFLKRPITKTESEEIPCKLEKTDDIVPVVNYENYDIEDGEVEILEVVHKKQKIEVIDITCLDDSDSDIEVMQTPVKVNDQVSQALKSLMNGQQAAGGEIIGDYGVDSSDEEEVEISNVNASTSNAEKIEIEIFNPIEPSPEEVITISKENVTVDVEDVENSNIVNDSASTSTAEKNDTESLSPIEPSPEEVITKENATINREEVEISNVVNDTTSIAEKNDIESFNPEEVITSDCRSVLNCSETNATANGNNFTSSLNEGAITNSNSNNMVTNMDVTVSVVENQPIPMEIETSLEIEVSSSELEVSTTAIASENSQQHHLNSNIDLSNCTDTVVAEKDISANCEALAANVAKVDESVVEEEKDAMLDELNNGANDHAIISSLTEQNENERVPVSTGKQSNNLSIQKILNSSHVSFSSEDEEYQNNIIMNESFCVENMNFESEDLDENSMDFEDSVAQTDHTIEDSQISLSYINDLENRLMATPLKTTTNTTLHNIQIAPYKKVEKAIWRIREGTPERIDNENTENEPNCPRIVNTFSLCDITTATIKEHVSSQESMASSFITPPNSDHDEQTTPPQQPNETVKPINDTASKNAPKKPVLNNNLIQNLIEKKMWNKVAISLKSSLEESTEQNDMFQPKAYIGLPKLTVSALLNPKERIAKDVKTNVTLIWKLLFNKYPISRQNREFYNHIFQEMEDDLSKDERIDDAPEGYSYFYQHLIAQVQFETPNPKRRKDCLLKNQRASTPILDFLESITTFFNDEYQNAYLSQTVRTNKPKILEFLNSNTSYYNVPLQHLLKKLFSLVEFPEPFYCVLRWVSLLANHFLNNSKLPQDPMTVVLDDFCAYLRLPNIARYQIDIIQGISPSLVPCPTGSNKRDFREMVSFKLLRDFAYIDEPLSTDVPDESPETDKKLRIILLLYFKTFVNKGLEYEKRFTQQQSTVDSPNNYGEVTLHKLVKSGNQGGLKSYLRDLTDRQSGTMNPRDHGNNTPLHDAAEKGWNMVFPFYNHWMTYNKGKEVQDYNLTVNLLARNHKGDTPLHIAAASNHDTVVECLLMWASACGIKNAALIAKNEIDQTPYDMTTCMVIKRILQLPQLECINGLTLAPTSRVKVMSKLRFIELLKLWHCYYRPIVKGQLSP